MHSFTTLTDTINKTSYQLSTKEINSLHDSMACSTVTPLILTFKYMRIKSKSTLTNCSKSTQKTVQERMNWNCSNGSYFKSVYFNEIVKAKNY